MNKARTCRRASRYIAESNRFRYLVKRGPAKDGSTPLPGQRDTASPALWSQHDPQHSKFAHCGRIMLERATSVLSLIRTTRLRDIIDTHQRLAADLSELRSTVLPRLQRVERDLMGAKLDWLFGQLHIAIQLTVRQGVETGQAIEKGLRAVLAPLPRGSAGGLARARIAWRYSDGTFMRESERAAAIEELELAEYERFAAGGHARAKKAVRNRDGTFA